MICLYHACIMSHLKYVALSCASTHPLVPVGGRLRLQGVLGHPPSTAATVGRELGELSGKPDGGTRGSSAAGSLCEEMGRKRETLCAPNPCPKRKRLRGMPAPEARTPASHAGTRPMAGPPGVLPEPCSSCGRRAGKTLHVYSCNSPFHLKTSLPKDLLVQMGIKSQLLAPVGDTLPVRRHGAQAITTRSPSCNYT